MPCISSSAPLQEGVVYERFPWISHYYSMPNLVIVCLLSIVKAANLFSLQDFFSATLSPREILPFLRSSESRFLIDFESYTPESFPLGYAMWSRSWQLPDSLRQSMATFREGSFGFALAHHLSAMAIPGVDPIHSEIPYLRFPFDYPCSFPDWVMRRMQQTHDCLHVLLGLGVGQDDEMVLQAFYYSQGTQPMAMLFLMQELCSSFRSLRVDPNVFRRVSRVVEALRLGLHAQSDLISFPYEEHLGESLVDLRCRLGLDETSLSLLA
jgi:hypothetical protein